MTARLHLYGIVTTSPAACSRARSASSSPCAYSRLMAVVCCHVDEVSARVGLILTPAVSQSARHYHPP